MWRFEIEVPKFGDEEARTGASWELPLHTCLAGEGEELLYDGMSFRFVSPLVVEAEVRWSGEELLVDVGLNVALSSSCSRCLEPAGIEIREDFMYLYSLRKNVKGKKTSEEGEDYRMVTIPCWKSRLDISDQVYESLVLSLPSRALCSPACRGICPSCGRRLESGSCSCSSVEIDPRLEELLAFETDDDT
ncbi:MAG: DUF177 domain-containing protein [Synergistaceae bacterium]|nr:DUF177 domain-containing protein [Synergistota bacterium]NLM70913.1 DUF177 domain-containing protein [Synergistaceae bacterium]